MSMYRQGMGNMYDTGASAPEMSETVDLDGFVQKRDLVLWLRGWRQACCPHYLFGYANP